MYLAFGTLNIKKFFSSGILNLINFDTYKQYCSIFRTIWIDVLKKIFFLLISSLFFYYFSFFSFLLFSSFFLRLFLISCHLHFPLLILSSLASSPHGFRVFFFFFVHFLCASFSLFYFFSCHYLSLSFLSTAFAVDLHSLRPISFTTTHLGRQFRFDIRKCAGGTPAVGLLRNPLPESMRKGILELGCGFVLIWDGF